MKIARLLMVLAALAMFAFATTGCDKGGKAAGEIEKVADKACACKDKKCADDVWKEFKTLMTKHKDTKGDDKAIKRVEKAASKAFECLAKQGVSPEEIMKFTQSL
jgi:hypothetical protein